MRDLARGLYVGRNTLVFEHEGASLPDHLTVEQLLILFEAEATLIEQQLISFKGLLRAQGVYRLRDFLDEMGEWRRVDSFCRATRRTCHGDNFGLTYILGLIQQLAPPKVNLQL